MNLENIGGERQNNKEMDILKNVHLETKKLNEIKNSKESITNRLDHAEDSLSGLKDKVYPENIHKVETRDHGQNTQEIWDNIKRLELRITGIEENNEIQTRDMHNLFSEISEKFPALRMR